MNESKDQAPCETPLTQPSKRAPYAWEVCQNGRTYLLSAQEFAGKSYDCASFKALFLEEAKNSDSALEIDTLKKQVKNLQDLIKKVKDESQLIDYQGKPSLVVPYWFLRAPE